MLFVRMLRAIRFERALYDELRKDPVALAQAVAVIAIAILAIIIGATLDAVVNNRAWLNLVLQGLIIMPGMWLLPATSLFFLGGLARAHNPERGSNRDLLIAIGYSAAPGVGFLLLGLPDKTNLIFGGITIFYMFVSMIVAAKAILQVSLVRSVAFVAPGILMYLMVNSYRLPAT